MSTTTTTTTSSTSTKAPHPTSSSSSGGCPVMNNPHAYCPPRPGDLRSPCPALNTLANHGYLPRDGKNIGALDIAHALQEGYRLSRVLAYFLSFAGYFMLSQYRKMSLWDLARHNLIEHDASLFHLDAMKPDDEYPPTNADSSLVRVVCQEAGRYVPGRMTLEDVANIRVKRESECRPLDGVHAEIARGEMAIAIGILGGRDAAKNGLGLDVLRRWVEQEQLPDDWKPDHTQGLYQTYKLTTVVRERMKAIRAGKMPNVLDSPCSAPVEATPAEETPKTN